MLQIAYTSVASQSLGSGDVFKIIEKSAQNNAKAGLTGFLIFSDGQFFQVIEGSVSSVDNLINRLKTDQRHHSIKIVSHERVIDRYFPNWSMKRLAVPDIGTPLEKAVPELENAPAKIRRAAENFLKLAVA